MNKLLFLTIIFVISCSPDRRAVILESYGYKYVSAGCRCETYDSNKNRLENCVDSRGRKITAIINPTDVIEYYEKVQ